MQIIRNKRQSSAGGAQPGQQKNKYRKRSVSKGLAVSHRSSRSADVQRATPPGKCHSCNIRETPEWRRGPDGARTLCNACGLRTSLPQYLVVAQLTSRAQTMRSLCANATRRSTRTARHRSSTCKPCVPPLPRLVEAAAPAAATTAESPLTRSSTRALRPPRPTSSPSRLPRCTPRLPTRTRGRTS